MVYSTPALLRYKSSVFFCVALLLYASDAFISEI